MKTTFPFPDSSSNQRLYALDAGDYARHFAPEATLPASRAFLPQEGQTLDSQEREVEQLAISIGLASLEVFMGRRPCQHLKNWTSVPCYRRIERQVKKTHQILADASAHFPQLTLTNKPKPRLRPRRIIVQKASDQAYEISLLVSDNYRTRALALRAEKMRKQWKITALEIA